MKSDGKGIIEPESIRKLVVRCPNWLGDAVMATPVLKEIRDLFPHAEIIGISHPAIQTLFDGSPFFNRFLSFRRDGHLKKEEEKRLIHTLRQEKPDLGILLTRSFSSAWSFFRGGVPIRLGLSDHFRSLFLTHSIKEKPSNIGRLFSNEPLAPIQERHDVDTYCLLLNRIKGGHDRFHAPRGPISLYVKDEEKHSLAMKLQQEYDVIPNYHTIITINPGAAYGSAKCWPKESFRSVIENLITDQKNRVIVIGDEKTKPLIDEIVLRLPPRVINLAAKTNLRELMAVISLSNVVLTNDSGPMHIASALHVPLVALFGSTNPYRTGPFNGGKVIYKKVLCSPCYMRRCPIDFRCMTSISVEEVLDSLQSELHRNNG